MICKTISGLSHLQIYRPESRLHQALKAKDLEAEIVFLSGRKVIESSLYLLMPTVLFILGWRLYFYSNENKEPMHVHAQKGDMEGKFWLFEEEMDVRQEYTYNMSPKDLKEIRKIIFENFDFIVDSWNNYFNKES